MCFRKVIVRNGITMDFMHEPLFHDENELKIPEPKHERQGELRMLFSQWLTQVEVFFQSVCIMRDFYWPPILDHKVDEEELIYEVKQAMYERHS